jgi:hypothetical protein
VRSHAASVLSLGTKDRNESEECGSLCERNVVDENVMTAIDRGLDIIRYAIEHPNDSSVAAAQQTLRNWHHRLDRMTVLNGAVRHELQSHMGELRHLLGELPNSDPIMFTRQQQNAQTRIEPIRRRLVALVGEHGMD